MILNGIITVWLLVLVWITWRYGLSWRPWARKAVRLLWAARNEWLAVPLAAVLFLVSSALIRTIDPTAGVFDTGVLQTLFVSAVQLFVSMTTAQVAVGISYKRLFRPKNNEPICKTRYVQLYALYFLASVVLIAAL